MRYTKQPTSITDQINLLKLRGLIIDDETEAKAVLERISYFRLASYWRPMEQDKVLRTAVLPFNSDCRIIYAFLGFRISLSKKGDYIRCYVVLPTGFVPSTHKALS